jgi:hypothetical protein
MIASQIGEDASSEADAINALQSQRVRRHLHHAGPASRREHLFHEALDLGRFRRRACRLEVTIAESIQHRPHQPALDPGCLEDRADQICGRGLAVGSGDADDLHLPTRVAVELCREISQCKPRIGHRDPGDVFRPWSVALRDHGRGAGGNRLRGKHCSIHLQTAKSDKHGSRLDQPRIVRDSATGLLQRGPPSRQSALVKRDELLQRAKEILDSHGASVVATRSARRSRMSTTVAPGSIGSPGAGDWSTTNPLPRSCAVKPRRDMTASASRALKPVTSGNEAEALAETGTCTSDGGGVTGPAAAS